MGVNPTSSESEGERGAGLLRVRRAILSVSDKSGVVEFARELARGGCELISTGGTAEALRNAGLEVTSIETLTGFPEMMDGRVKTLHPRVHGGLLAVRDDPRHASAMREHDIRAIDLVCVNLYPFERTVARSGCTRSEAVEQIDIGGPSMIRSGAKNHASVAVVTSHSQYGDVVKELHATGGCTTLETRRRLSAQAFASTARYDEAIASYFAREGARRHDDQTSTFPVRLTLTLDKVADLRYGENPHQRGALYRHEVQHADAATGLVGAEQLHGKALSYNNILDGSAAHDLAVALVRVDPARPGACVVKHTNPCGAAIAPSVREAVEGAISGDPLAAYGGILACNRPIDALAAEHIARKERFFEVVIAPGYDDAALDILRARWANVRLLATGDLAPRDAAQMEFRSITGGALVQESDVLLTPRERFEHRAGPSPSDAQLRTAMFLEAVARSLLSNAVVVGGLDAGVTLRMFGAGAGQMDRVTSCRLASEKAGAHALGAAAFSDAFFPFADGPRVLIEAGVTLLVHPGGSKRDQDTFDLCNERGVTCLLTGMRHFRH